MAKVLIVDDSRFMTSIIKNFAEKSGRKLEIIEAHSGEEAIKTYEAQRPDLVFMDIRMEGMDGLEALERIRAADTGARVVMCTSLGEPEQERRAAAAGAAGYIRKPFRSEEIIEAIRKNVPE